MADRDVLHEHFRRLLCERERASRAGDWETFHRAVAEIEEIRAQKVPARDIPRKGC